MKRSYKLVFVLFGFFILLLLFGRLSFQTTSADSDPTAVLQQAWEMARQSGRYHFRSLMEQTVYPAPAVQNAGRQPRQDRLGVDGQVDISAETMNMTLWEDGSFNPQSGIEVKVEDGQTFGRQGEGEWQLLNNFADSFAPGGDPLGFLAGAVNIQAGGTETRTFDGLELTYSHYTFDIDGALLGDHLIKQTDRYEEKYGPMPGGMALQVPESYRNLSGQGEIWLNEAGLPAHLSLTMDLPDQPKAGERATAVITTDYSRFDLSQLSLATTPLFRDPAAWLAFRLPGMQTAVQQQLPGLQLFTLLILVVIISLHHRHSRRFYGAVISLVIVSMLTSPLLQGQYAAAYFDRVEADQAIQQSQEEEAEQQQEIETAVQERKDNWNPQQNPLMAGQEQATASAAAAKSQLSTLLPTGQPNSDALLAAGDDSDNDGLSDELEDYWASCAFLVGSPEYDASAECEGIADPTDSDGDGLSDDAEVNYLNTFPTSSDTDGDGISDRLEIEGFTYNGKTWYLNPNEEDSNNDGQPDSLDCNIFIPGPLDLNVACGDTDGNGVPDNFDPDNDGDGIPDSEDLSPNFINPTIFDRSNPFELSIDNLTLDQPLLVDFQIRPLQEDHLYYHNQVLDWPFDDDGQIQRHLDTTWADTANSEYQSSAANAANGDIRLVPMLEVIIPYQNGHYGNLPVNATFDGTTRTLGVPVEDWLDEQATRPYGLSIDDIDPATGDLLVYVPLNPVLDKQDTPVGYSARLLYQPNQAGWGEAHSVRVIWLVQMLTDECIDPAEPEATCARQDVVNVIHTYLDEWQLSGLNISEEYGLDVGLMYEDPALDDDLTIDDELWGAVWNLGNTFMRARDCESYSGDDCVGNGQRDVTVANLGANLASWELDYTNLETRNYPHQGFIAHVMMTDTVSILDTVFTPYADQTVPTILIAQEQRSRMVNADGFSGPIGSDMTFDLAPAAVPLQTYTTLSWASYKYDNGAWINYEPDAYLDYLRQSIALRPFFQPVDNSQGALGESEGKLLWAQYYYAALLQGSRVVVQIDSDVLSQKADKIPDVSYAPFVPPGTFWGLGQMMTEINMTIFSKYASPYLAKHGFGGLTESIDEMAKVDQFTNYNRGGGIRGVALAVIALALIGTALIVAGAITGDQRLVRIGTIIMAIVTIIVAVYYIVLAVFMMYFSFVLGGVSAAITTGKLFQGMGLVGLVIGLALTWGIIAYQITSKGLHGAALNTALAVAVAATIIIFIYFFLDLIGLGILVLILVLIDAIFILFNKPGPTQLLTELIADSLYGVDVLIKNADDADRLAMDFTGFSLADPELGFSIENTFVYTVTVTNTVQYRRNFFFSDLKNQAVFRYFLQIEEIDHHSDLEVGDMSDEWVNLGHKMAQTTQTKSLSVPLLDTAIGVGINRSLDGDFFLTESFLLPYRGCWQLNGEDLICKWYKLKDSSHINLGQELTYDILPATLTEFAEMRWDPRVRVQADVDNDGLLATDGNDPDPKSYDSDADTLSDYYEIIYGLNPLLADTDGDGLNDADELRYRTNPFQADSDRDGLNDFVETKQGWLVSYKNYGVSSLTRVWSNPNIPDADGDTLNDREEFIFGFHPQVSTDPSLIANLVEFDNLNVAEANGLKLLARFEEPTGSETFFDSAGFDNQMNCDRANNDCPAAHATGRYGYALTFDGSDDYLDLPFVYDPAETTFTAAAWFKTTDNTNQPIILQQEDGGGVGRAWLYVNTSGTIGTFLGGNSYSGVTPVTLNTWHHAAVTYDGTTLSLYLDGVLDVQTAKTMEAADGELLVGRHKTLTDRFFTGALDEIALLDKALTGPEIGDLMNGRYNPNDRILSPSEGLAYQATITNTHFLQEVDGYLTGQSGYYDPVIEQPDLVLHFDDTDYVTTFANGTGESSTATCLNDGSCPWAQVAGYQGRAVQFNGINDWLTLPAVSQQEFDRHALAFWINPIALPAAGQIGSIITTDSAENGAVQVYLTSAGKIVVDVLGAVTRPHTSVASLPAGGWNHVLINLEYLGGPPPDGRTVMYINGALDSMVDYSAFDRPLVGPGLIGNNMDGSSPLDGKIDSLVFYNDEYLGIETNINRVNEVRTGNFYPGLNHSVNVGVSWPALILTFNENPQPYNPTSVVNDAGPNLSCALATCPGLDYEGNGSNTNEFRHFDGVDDFIPLSGEQTYNSLDIELRVKVDALPTSANTDQLFSYSASGLSVQPEIYLNSAGNIVVATNQGTGTAVSTFAFNGATLGQWVDLHFYISFDNSNNRVEVDLWVNDVLDINEYWITGVLASNLRFGGGRIGAAIDGSRAFDGSIDDVRIKRNGTLGYNLKFEVDAPLNRQYINDVNDDPLTYCVFVHTCPSQDANGRFGQALSFDGVDDNLLLDEKLDFQGDFTIGMWVKSSSGSTQTLLDGRDLDDVLAGLVHLRLLNTGAFRFTYFGYSGALIGLTSSAGFADGNWHYVTVVREAADMRLYVDGQLEAADVATANPIVPFDIMLGRLQVSAVAHFNGLMDELTLIPAAVSEIGIQSLMNSVWPAIGVNEDFVPFNVLPESATDISGSAAVNDNVVSGLHTFYEEVDAALQLQAPIPYPVVDSHVADLIHFLPLEDAPGSTLFENIVNVVNGQCANNECPAGGTRGQVDRAAYFDGLDDGIFIDDAFSASQITIAAWVKADRGTLVSVGDRNTYIELDFNQLKVVTDEDDVVIYTLPFQLPENEWVHVTAVIDGRYVGSGGTGWVYVYVNGQLVNSVRTNVHTSAFYTIGMGNPYLGRNRNGTDTLHGYLDDVRIYKSLLIAGDILTLYETSAPELRFGFDEDEDATAFIDNSNNHYVGLPSLEQCAALDLDSLTVNSLSSDPSTVFVSLDGEWLTAEMDTSAGANLTANVSSVLCEQQTLAVGVTDGGSLTILGSLLLDANTPGPNSQIFTSSGSSVTLNWTVDSASYFQPNPAPGTHGRIGNGLVFDGAGYLDVPDSNDIAAMTSSFTIMAWINPADLGGFQHIFSASRLNSNNGFGMAARDYDLGFASFGIQNYYINNVLKNNYWQHVAVVFDSGYDATIYLNGVNIGTVNGSSPPGINNDDDLMIGATRAVGTGALSGFFKGLIDEVGFYGRELTDAEINSIYLREVRWYRDTAVSYLTIDNDSPTIDLLSDATYRPNGYVQLAVATSDPTSHVALLDFGLKGPLDANYNWYGALPCQDNGQDGAVWCPYFDTSLLGGEGKYEMLFRAVDAVGNETLSPVQTFYVDNTPPTAASVYSGQWLLPTSQDDSGLQWTMSLSGTLNDPDIITTPAVVGSGVVTQSVLVTLFSKDHIVDEEAQQAIVSGSTWSIDYLMEGARPHGDYTIRLKLMDEVGNEAVVDVGTIKFDERPPQASLDYWELDEDVISMTTTLNGIVSDQADWAGEVAKYHFEETAGSTTFYDSSSEAHHGTCTNCPTSVAGFYDQGLSFDGSDDYVVTPFLRNPVSETFSISLWFNPDSGGIGDRRLVHQLDGSGLGRNLLSLDSSNRLYAFLGGVTATAVTSATADTWHHAAFTFDGTTYTIYLDGIEEASATITGESSDGGLVLGISKDLSSNAFPGMLDEVLVFSQALDNYEVFALAQPDSAGVQSVDIALEAFDFVSNSLGGESFSPPVWQPAVLSGGLWHYDLTTVPEGFYDIHLRSTDNFGNARDQGVAWRGLIDTVSPTVIGTGQHIGGGTAAQTEYSFSFSDFILDETSYSQPCNSGSLVSLTYSDPLLPQDGLPYDVTATCRVPNHEASREITVCDSAALCTTLTIIPTPGPDIDSIAILNPLNNTNFGGPGTKSISGGAYDLNEIQTIVIRVDGLIIDTITPAPNITDTLWSTTWTPSVSGTYTISATLTDALNNDLVDTVMVTVGDGSPTAITMGMMAAGAADYPDGVVGLWAALLLMGTAVMFLGRRKKRNTTTN